MDGDGYPEAAELETIKDWPYGDGADYKALMEYVKERWNYADCGYWVACKVPEMHRAIDGTLYQISTGGWSGNEEIIQAMERNHMFWAFCWWQSRRGGHYEFVLR